MEIYAAAGGLVLLGFGAWTAREMIVHFKVAPAPVRFTRMVERLGMSVDEIIESDFAYHLPTAQRFCTRCERKVECDALLCARDQLADPPAFCPNAAYLRMARHPSGAVD